MEIPFSICTLFFLGGCFVLYGMLYALGVFSSAGGGMVAAVGAVVFFVCLEVGLE